MNGLSLQEEEVPSWQQQLCSQPAVTAPMPGPASVGGGPAAPSAPPGWGPPPGAVNLAALPSHGGQEELRIDLSDGQAYPKWSFMQVYGGTVEWDRAQSVAPALDGSVPPPAANAPPPQLPGWGPAPGEKGPPAPQSWGPPAGATAPPADAPRATLQNSETGTGGPHAFV